MKNPASIPLPAVPTSHAIQHPTIQIPTEKDVKEGRRQQALERLRAQNRALPQEPTRSAPILWTDPKKIETSRGHGEESSHRV
jgi:hypothetical protein